MKLLCVAGLLILICLGIYWPHKNAEFILDDYYTVVRNPLIKNPSLFHKVWTSHLFDAHQSSGYIKFGYYRPVLQSSWMLDYHLFGLKAFGYQWINLLIHALNCLLAYILLLQLFGKYPLALKASLLFCVLPSQEWVVRYITGRGDELSALFALLALVSFLWVLKNKDKKGYVLILLFWLLSCLTREVAISYLLFAVLIYFFAPQREDKKDGEINRFGLSWFLIGILPLTLIWTIIPKLGHILALHILYFSSIGLCLWMAQLRLRWFVLLLALFTVISSYQGRFWTTEETLLRHTRSLEFSQTPTVVAQQLLMRYDEDLPAINSIINKAHDPLIKGMWLRRLGLIYFNHGDLKKAQEYFSKTLVVNPLDVDTLNALAVVYLRQGQDSQGLTLLNQSVETNPSYADTYRTLGIYYYLHKDMTRARYLLKLSLEFEPDNPQAQELLLLANKSI